MSSSTAVKQTKTINFGSLQKIEVKIENLEGKNYVLREATGAAAAHYKNEVFKKSRFGPDGKPQGFDGVADVEPLLVSLCLYEVGADAQAHKSPVSLAVIKSWPARVVGQLFTEAKRISGMENDDETAEGLQEQIQVLQDKLNAKRQAQEGDPKN